MKVFKIIDEYATWVVAKTAQEAIQYYIQDIVGNDGQEVTDITGDEEITVTELTDEEVTTQKVIIDTDEDDNPILEKTFAEILKDNEDAEDKSPWVIAAEID